MAIDTGMVKSATKQKANVEITRSVSGKKCLLSDVINFQLHHSYISETLIFEGAKVSYQL